MKKIIITSLLAVMALQINAQDDTMQNFHEIKVNGLYLVLGAFEVTYEQSINEESAFGANLFLPFDKEINDNYNFYLSPYYRFYFGKKYASGFFIEGFSLLSSYNYKTSTLTLDSFITEEQNKFALAFGIGVGGKWITKSGFIGELGLGVGRNVINNEDFSDNPIGKINIGVGYRF